MKRETDHLKRIGEPWKPCEAMREPQVKYLLIQKEWGSVILLYQAAQGAMQPSQMLREKTLLHSHTHCTGPGSAPGKPWES